MMNVAKGLGILLGLLLPMAVAAANDSKPVELSGPAFKVLVWPDSWAVTVQFNGGGEISISEPGAPVKIEKVSRRNNVVSWSMPDQQLEAAVFVRDRELQINIGEVIPDGGGKRPDITWPRLSWGKSDATPALIFPHHGGMYINMKDEWDFLSGNGETTWDTSEGLFAPLWGLDYEKYTVTYIAGFQHYNEMVFRSDDSHYRMTFTHQGTPLAKSNIHSIRVFIDERTSPLTPALHFRDMLKERKSLVPFTERIAKNPKAEWLLGAPHAYVWGGDILSYHDVEKNQWKALCDKLASEDADGKKLFAALDKETQDMVTLFAKGDWPHLFGKKLIAHGVSEAVSAGDVYTSETLTVAFPGVFKTSKSWGDGVSVKMIRSLKDAGIERIKLCAAGMDDLRAHPEAATLADKEGYLFGIYDSYHSIHPPSMAGSGETWETAQFDQELFDNGTVMNANGVYTKGFKGIGRIVNSKVARPWVEKRVTANLAAVPGMNYYFIDCDAFGQLYEDYSKGRELTRSQDGAARTDRLDWIAGKGMIIGSEGCSAYAMGSVHVAEGATNPGYGWGDEDLKNKDSEFYLGRYYPGDEPDVFFKPVPMKSEYIHELYDPKTHVPLFEAVWHDSVISAPHWSNGSLKHTNVANLVALREVLYATAPMYHLNLDEFTKRKETIKAHLAVWGPLHRRVGGKALTSFEWLSEDRMVQRTTFEEGTRVTVNFGEGEFVEGETRVPAMSALIVGGEAVGAVVYTPRIEL